MSTEVTLFDYFDTPGRPHITGVIDSNNKAQVRIGGVPGANGVATVAGNPLAAYSTDSSNNVTGLVAPGGGVMTSLMPKRGVKAPNALLGDDMQLSDFSLIAGAGVTLSMTTINGRNALKVDVPAGAITASVGLLGLTGATFHGEFYVQMLGNRAAQVDGTRVYVSPDSYANMVDRTYTLSAASTNNPVEQGDVYTMRSGQEDWTTTGTITYPFTVANAKININPVSTSAYTAYILGIGFAPKTLAGRIAIVVDDGYSQWFKLGQNLCDARGLKVTHAVIPAFIAAKANGAASISQYKSAVNNGHAVIAHGPNFADGYTNGNLLSRYTTTADRIADIQTVIKWISDNGFATPDYEKCYIYPQGQAQASAADFTLFDAMLLAGITTARLANGYQTLQPTNFDATSKYQHLSIPVIGHTWAGSTALEATNISNLTTRINAAATNGTDCVIMFHKVQPTATADGSMTSTDIRLGDIATLLDAIQTKVTAGTLRSVLFTDIALSRQGNFWQA